MLKVQITERGTVPRKMRVAYNAASIASWRETGVYFHTTYRPRRFTTEHAKEAKYAPRSGEDLPFGSKAFWRSYIGRKIRQKKHRRPLEWSGYTRRAVQTANLTTDSKQVKIRYNTRIFNFRPSMRDEFTRIIPSEARQLGRIYDQNLNRRFG